MTPRHPWFAVVPLLALSGCGSETGDPADARSLASLFCRTVANVDEKARPDEFASCMRLNLPSATDYSDCLARAGEFAVESEQFRCMDEAGWSPY